MEKLKDKENQKLGREILVEVGLCPECGNDMKFHRIGCAYKRLSKLEAENETLKKHLAAETRLRKEAIKQNIAQAREIKKLTEERKTIKAFKEILIEDLEVLDCLSDKCFRNNINRFIRDIEQNLLPDSST